MSSGIPIQSKIKRVSILTLQNMKKRGEIICASSIYDAQTARLFDQARVQIADGAGNEKEVGGDLIIVGDSAAMAVQGRQNTLPMTMDEMIMFCRAVRNGTERLFIVGDMPLGSYEVSDEDAVRNAMRFMKEVEPGCDAVKVETNMAYVRRIKAIADACLVVAHIGLNPNKAAMLGGYRTQGKTKESFQELLRVISAVEEAGACMVLIESVTEEITQEIKAVVDIPVIGIAAGRNLDGQLVISSDLLGLFQWPGNPPVHFEQYRTDGDGVTIGEATSNAFKWYVKAVKERRFPSDKHVHHLPDGELGHILESSDTVD